MWIAAVLGPKDNTYSHQALAPLAASPQLYGEVADPSAYTFGSALADICHTTVLSSSC